MNVKLLSGLELKPTAYELYYDGKKVDLTTKERKLIELLGLNKGAIVTMEQIAEHVLGDPDAKLNAVRNIVWRVRKKLPHDIIEMVSSEGYRINV